MYNALLVSLIILVTLMLGAIIFAFVRIQKLINSIEFVNRRINHIVCNRQMTDEERKLMNHIISESINVYPQMLNMVEGGHSHDSE